MTGSASERRACIRCGRELRAEARFCDGCGAPQLRLPRRPSSGELRTVTVLFADLKGYTTLSEHLEPDDVHELVRRIFQITDEAIDACGGRVEKHMGDAVLALFGVPAASGRDPENAVRAALKIQEELVALNSTMSQEGLPHVELRIGINTGRVALASVGQADGHETSVYGDTVNIAARLESACPPGGVMLSAATWRFLDGRYPGRRLAPIKLRGRSEPVTPFVLDIRDIHGPVANVVSTEVLGQRTEIIGREVELLGLAASLDACIESQTPAAAMIEGSPGSGKSRLMQALLDRCASKIGLALQTRASPETQHTPYALMVDLLSEAPTMDPAGLEALRVCGSVSSTPLNDLSGHLGALREWLRTQKPQGVVALIIDDLQWADAESLSFLNTCLDETLKRPIFLIATCRPEGFEDGSPLAGAHHLSLDPLSSQRCSLLVTHLLSSVVGVPDTAIESIAERAAGVPYFAVEIVKSLPDHGVIEARGAGWRWSKENPEINSVPATVEGVLQSRLDAAGKPASGVAKIGAALGRRFRLSTLEALVSQESLRASLNIGDPEQLASLLGALVQREILEADHKGVFNFVHDLMRDVAYASIPKRAKRSLHLAIAAQLEQERASGRPVPAARIARQHDAAGSRLPAGRWFRVAGEESSRLEAYGSAHEHFKAAIEHQGQHNPRLLATLFIQDADAASSLGLLEEACTGYLAALNQDPDPAPSPIQARAHMGLAYAAYLQGDRESCAQEAEVANAQAQQLDDPALLARTLNVLGIHWGSSGHYEKAIKLYRAAADAFEACGMQDRVASNLSNIGINLHLLGRLDAALHIYDRAVALAESLNRKNTLCNAHANRADLLLAMGRYQAAREGFEIARVIVAEQGMLAVEGECLGGLAQAALGLEELETALSQAITARRLCAKVGLRVYEGRAALTEARARAGLGRDSRAAVQEIFLMGLSLLREAGEPYELAQGLSLYANYLDTVEASQAADPRAEAKSIFESLSLDWKVQALS